MATCREYSTLALTKRFLSEALVHKHLLLLSSLSIVGATLATLASPYILKVAIDQYILKHRFDGLWLVASLYLLALTAQWLFNTLQFYYTQVFGQRVLRELRTRLFEKVLHAHLDFYKEKSTGDLVSRIINDTSMVNEILVTGLFGGLANILTVTGIAVAMFILDVKLTLAVLASIPVMVVVAKYFGGRMRRSYRATREKIARLSSIVEESVSGIETIQSFGGEKAVRSEFSGAAMDTAKAYMKVAVYMGLFWPLMSLASLLSVIIVLTYGSYLALQGATSIGVVVAFIQYAQRFRGPINNVVSMYDSLQSALAALERIYEVIDDGRVEDYEGEEVGRLGGEVDLQDVWFEYEPGRPVLRGVSFHVEKGSKVALVGETGAGKTTIASLILRFYDPSEGRILLDGRDSRLLSRRAVRRRIGYVPQEPYLFPGTVMENLLVGNPMASREDAVRVCKQLGVHEFIMKLPKGYDTPAGEAGKLLSVGERQLISIARVMLRNPDIVVLDEALSSVDPKTEDKVTRALLELMKGRTSLIIAHRLSITRHADKIIAIKDGKIVEEGPPSELLQRRGYYYQLYQAQVMEEEAVAEG
ncbi:MAG: ABC transporter ATP-binding protein/permease [Desulfurococcales archaeon]|nr:ABC transporter ATP-binding protein/permease [Desulfurococcales archaeon]